MGEMKRRVMSGIMKPQIFVALDWQRVDIVKPRMRIEKNV